MSHVADPKEAGAYDAHDPRSATGPVTSMQFSELRKNDFVLLFGAFDRYGEYISPATQVAKVPDVTENDYILNDVDGDVIHLTDASGESIEVKLVPDDDISAQIRGFSGGGSTRLMVTVVAAMDRKRAVRCAEIGSNGMVGADGGQRNEQMKQDADGSQPEAVDADRKSYAGEGIETVGADAREPTAQSSSRSREWEELDSRDMM
ncbi:hypothetical protein BJ138DRAFT_1181583 [Hygrophoropsis aurantiaca]|uniref:Uncharacterized protein n=1 Tax=Hygrophoropsis aurantiaca TaxID=72124 RepID=A0ACB8A6I3_9AGAM|nr:hypothetical protein BJ138DRAFT_1181583 [Hygrophoropsis aurantiaca]